MRKFQLDLMVALLAIAGISAASSVTSAQTPPAQAPPATAAPGGTDDASAAKQFEKPATKPFTDLTHRYRFAEIYTKVEERASSALVGQYQIGMLETLKDSIETPEGKPKQTELVRRTIFTERPAEVSSLGVVAATIRRYDKFLVEPEEALPSAGRRPLDGLTLFFRPKLGEQPEIVSLSKDRRIREREFEIVAHQVFLPALSAIFPAYPPRVGDNWRVSKRAAQALLGEPEIRGDNLTAKFTELLREESTNRMFAIFTITGRVSNTFAETIVNARIEFAFDPPATKKPTTPGSTPLVATAPATKPLDESIIDARGAITELRMARVAAGLLPDATRKLNFSAQQELILRRKLGVEAGSKPLALVTPPPANDVNSWISYVDPAGRFYFHHPQELLPPERFQLSGSADDDSIVIVKNRPDGREMVRIDVFREAMEPDALQDVLAAEWRRSGAEVLPGPSEWLPEAAFPAPLKVFRIESALKLGARGARLHYDAYLVKYSDDINLMVIATSSRDAVDAFRRNVEAMIATFKLGAPNH